MYKFLMPKIQGTGSDANPLKGKANRDQDKKKKKEGKKSLISVKGSKKAATLRKDLVPVKKPLNLGVNIDAKKLSALPENLLQCTETIILKKYDLKLLGHPGEGKRIGIIGTSGSGKTKLMLEMMRINMDIPAWMIINPSERTNKAYGRYVPCPGVIHDSADVDKILEKIYKFKKRQILTCEAWEIPDSDPQEYRYDPRGALIVDDCNEKGKKLYIDGVWGWIYCNSRNAHSHVWILVQYLYQLVKEHRKQLSHVFAFRVSSEDDFKTLYKEFGGAFANVGGLKTFIKVFAKATEDRRCIVIDVGTQAVKLEDRIFWYKASPKQEPFTVGAPWWQKMCKEEYDPDWKQKHPELANEGLDFVPKGSKKAKEKPPKPKKFDPEDIDVILQE